MAVDLQKIHGGREVIYAFFAKLFLEPVSENEYKMIQEILPLLKNLEDISETAGKEKGKASAGAGTGAEYRLQSCLLL